MCYELLRHLTVTFSIIFVEMKKLKNKQCCWIGAEVRFLGKRTSLNIGCFCVPKKNSWLPQRLTLGHRFFIWIHSIEQTNMSSALKVQRKTGLSNPQGASHSTKNLDSICTKLFAFKCSARSTIDTLNGSIYSHTFQS